MQILCWICVATPCKTRFVHKCANGQNGNPPYSINCRQVISVWAPAEVLKGYPILD
jgi:hypothetical protein